MSSLVSWKQYCVHIIRFHSSVELKENKPAENKGRKNYYRTICTHAFYFFYEQGLNLDLLKRLTILYFYSLGSTEFVEFNMPFYYVVILYDLSPSFSL